MALRLEPAARGGDQVLVAADVSLEIGARTLVRGFRARVQRGEVVGLVGANGSGKSTLLRAIAGERTVSSGTLRVGDSIDVAYYRQDLAQVPAGRTLFSIIHDLRPLWQRGQVHGHLGRFGFSGEAALRNADVLSGGERARVALAMLMLTRANLLLLDEPTNHLDVESIEALEDSIADFDGTVILVSHDRALLRGVATTVWSLADERIEVHEATFGEWEQLAAARAAEAERARREAAEAAAARASRAREKETARGGAPRPGTRQRQRAAEAAEHEVHRIEQQLSEIEAALADPALYQDPAAGALRAAELAALRTRLELQLAEAFTAWEAAAGELESGR